MADAGVPIPAPGLSHVIGLVALATGMEGLLEADTAALALGVIAGRAAPPAPL